MSFFKRFFRKIHKKSDIQLSENVSTKHEESLKSVSLSKDFERLLVTDEGYFTTKKKPYCVDGVLKPETISKVFDFAYNMTFGGQGEHRDHRSGGSHERRKGEIFANTFQGKIAECAACNFFHKYDNQTRPDFSVYKLGKWDAVDLSVVDKEISVKSTKSFGQLLLLETKDWDDTARYIPNGEKRCL